MKHKNTKSPKDAKLSIVIEKLEKKVDKASAAPGSCIRVYCLPAV